MLALTTTEPPHEATHCTAAAMAKAVGISAAHLARPWPGPHPMRHFKLSSDPEFVAKLGDIIWLYLNPHQVDTIRVVVEDEETDSSEDMDDEEVLA